MDGGFECFNLYRIEIGVEYNLREELDSLGEELGFEGEGELCEFSRDIDIELPTERLH